MSARSLNKVSLIGNLTRDPELRYTPQGTAVCTFGLATNRNWTDSSGQKQEEAEFHRIVAWQKLAELCSQLLFKGRKIFVEGRLQTRKWAGQDGQERQTTEIVIDNMIILDSRRREGDEERYGQMGQEAESVVMSADSTAGASSASKADDTAGAAVDDSKKKKTAKDIGKGKKVGKKTDKGEEVSAEDIPF